MLVILRFPTKKTFKKCETVAFSIKKPLKSVKLSNFPPLDRSRKNDQKRLQRDPTYPIKFGGQKRTYPVHDVYNFLVMFLDHFS